VLKRVFQLALVLVATFTIVGAGTPSSRFDSLGHKLMCPCGCAEILLECNHVGCPDSDRMIGELRTQMSTAAPDGGVLNWFVNKYGPTVLAAPIRGGFDNVAWIVPFAALFAGILAVVLLLRSWKLRHPALPTSVADSVVLPASDSAALRDRIRQETRY
jgi:cytochrome c-type biogenesis protein CcmH